ncbi:MAG TPA: hypothetical protein VJ349_13795, partial [Stellaceae bacterium]|nr:hypothetical protein [Stellaceae bacterium]
VGRAIDNRGGRGVLTLSNVVLAAGLVLLGVAQGFLTLALAWAALGIGMGMGLYDPAFATLTGLYDGLRRARGPMPGGGGGVAPRGVPLSRSSAPRRHRRLMGKFGVLPSSPVWLSAVRRFGAKPRKNFVDDQAASPSSWKTPRMAVWMAA